MNYNGNPASRPEFDTTRHPSWRLQRDTRSELTYRVDPQPPPSGGYLLTMQSAAPLSRLHTAGLAPYPVTVARGHYTTEQTGGPAAPAPLRSYTLQSPHRSSVQALR